MKRQQAEIHLRLQNQRIALYSPKKYVHLLDRPTILGNQVKNRCNVDHLYKFLFSSPPPSSLKTDGGLIPQARLKYSSEKLYGNR